jgi:hypothetical protein
MPSVAVDQNGNTAIGYSASSASQFPSIRYAGRLESDPPGNLAQGEAIMFNGSGAQTHPAGRWGDYTYTAIDPSDGMTFWHVNEYLPTTSSASWFTRIGKFNFTGGGPTPTPTPTATPSCTPGINEGFDDITNLVPNGWFMQNNSQPLGATGWFQGNPAVFTSFDGAPNAYIGANFNNGAGLATISNRLLTPPITLQNGAQLTFYTRTTDFDPDCFFPDRLQVRMSTNGASTNVGTTATSVGDFTNLLLDINPTYADSYPHVWTQFTVTVTGVPSPTTDSAFRYFVENGGPSGANAISASIRC